MSRFVNLELGQNFEDESHPELVKDEAFYLTQANAEFAEARFEDALRSFARVLEFNPQNTSAWAGQVRALIELGEFREAKLWADKALEHFPTTPELLAAKAVALGRCGDLAGALAFSDASIEERGDTAYIWLARGDVLLAREERRADYCFDKALALAPQDWLTAWLAARIRYYYQQFTLALRLLQQALEWDANRVVLWLLLGRCQKELGLIAPAETSFRRAQEIAPRCPEADRALSELAEKGLFARLRSGLNQLFHK